MSPDTPERSKKILRQVKKNFGDEAAEAAFLAIADYLKTQSPKGIDPDLPSHFPAFITNIDATYAEYEDKVKTAFRSLELSSGELNSTNFALEKLNSSMNAMMDSLGQGLVFFGRDGVCSPVYSKISASFLDGSPGGRRIVDILHLDQKQIENFDLWLSIVFDTTSALSFDDLAELAPDHFINSNGQYIQLEYRSVMAASGLMAGVLLIATDKTRERQNQSDLLETQRMSKMIVSIARHRNQFRNFVLNLRHFIREVNERSDCQPVEMMRELHTYKGLSYMFNLDPLGDALHRAEDEARDIDDQTPLRDRIDDILAPVVGGLDDAERFGESLFGHEFMRQGQVRMIEVEKLVSLRDQVMRLGADAKALNPVLDFINDNVLGQPISQCMSTFSSELTRVASVQGKPEPNIRFVRGDTPIIMGDYEDVFETLVHLARNIMDHGIEDSITRRTKRKPDAGQILITTDIKDGQFHIHIQDDGRGFDLAAIRARMHQLGIAGAASQSDSTVIQMIFDPGFSTNARSTTLSGRGVGMYAILKAVEMRGGKIRAVIPADSVGAGFCLTLPRR